VRGDVTAGTCDTAGPVVANELACSAKDEVVDEPVGILGFSEAADIYLAKENRSGAKYSTVWSTTILTFKVGIWSGLYHLAQTTLGKQAASPKQNKSRA
jgi:hypothetical protein